MALLKGLWPKVITKQDHENQYTEFEAYILPTVLFYLPSMTGQKPSAEHTRRKSLHFLGILKYDSTGVADGS